MAPTVLCDICTMKEDNNVHLFWDCLYSQEFWSNIRNFQTDHNMQVDISYLNISFGMLNRNSIKNETKTWLL